MTRALPALAQALAKCTDSVNVTQIARSEGTAGPGAGGFLAGTLGELLGVARAAGVELAANQQERAVFTTLDGNPSSI